MVHPQLQANLEKLLEGVDLKALTRSSEALTRLYHENKPARALSLEQCLAYAVVRMPATYTVQQHVLQRVERSLKAIRSVLDIGCGPGGFAWSCLPFLPQLEELTLWDRNADFLNLARDLISNHPKTAGLKFASRQMPGDLERSFDCILASLKRDS